MPLFFDDPQLSNSFIAKKALDWAGFVVDQAKTVYQDLGMVFPVATSSTLLVLGRMEVASQADIAKTLSQPHQTVAQHLTILARANIIGRRKCAADARKHEYFLTAFGLNQYGLLEAYSKQADKVFSQLFMEANIDLSTGLDRLQQAMEQKPLSSRFTSHSTTKNVSARAV